MKVCSKCKIEKPLEDFYNRQDNGSGKRADCKVCNCSKVKKYRQENLKALRDYDKKRNSSKHRKVWRKTHSQTPKARMYERKKALRKYNITPEDYCSLLELQEGKCAICQEAENMVRFGVRYQLAVDHDHKTGKIRCLLCNNCNRILGMAKENPELLETMAKYLRHFNK